MIFEKGSGHLGRPFGHHQYHRPTVQLLLYIFTFFLNPQAAENIFANP